MRIPLAAVFDPHRKTSQLLIPNSEPAWSRKDAKLAKRRTKQVLVAGECFTPAVEAFER
jgi:hypothetical protein